MRIDYLRLPAFGAFTDEVIEFPPAKGLHIIYGRNEAGKSTLLRAVADALFGMPRNSQDDFLHRADNLRIEAGLSLPDGTALAFRRRYGQRNTLLDLEGKPLDDAVLLPFTHGLTRQEFENMFGLDHLRLREGGKGLLAAGGSLGESLFAAASGLSVLRKRLEELNSQADSLFKPRGTKDPVNSLAKEYRQRKQGLDSQIFTASQFAELEERYYHYLERLEKLEEELEATARSEQRLRRIQLTKPLLAQRERVEGALQELGEVPVLAPDAQERFKTHHLALTQAKEESLTVELRRERLEQELAGLNVPQEVLALEETITTLQQGLERYSESLVEGAALQEQVEALTAQALAKLGELDPFAQDLPSVGKYSFPVHLVESCNELAERFHGLELELAKAREAQNSRVQDLAATRKALEQFGLLPDISRLELLVKELNRAGDLESAYQDKLSKAGYLRTVLEQGLRRLAPWTGTLEELALAPLPLPASVAEFEQRVEELGQGRRDLTRELERLSRELAEQDRKLAELTAEGALPSRHELIQARQRREQGWQLVRRAWLKGEFDPQGQFAFAGDKPLADAYEESVAAADQVADTILSASERAARWAAIQRQRMEWEEQKRQVQAQLDALSAQEQYLAASWQGLWRPLGFAPRSPKEMSEWLSWAMGLLDRYQELLQVEREAQELADRLDHATQRLRAALQEVGIQTPAEGLAALMEQAERFCQWQRELRVRQHALQQRLQEQLGEEAKARNRVKELTSNLEAWQREWQEVLTALGLPAVTTVQGALSFLQASQTLQDLVRKLREAQERLARLQDFAAHFRSRALDVAGQVGLAQEGLEPESLVKLMGQRLLEARTAAAARREKDRQLAQEAGRLEELDLAISVAQEGLTALIAEAGVESSEDLAELLNRRAQAQELKRRLAELDEQLLAAGGGKPLAELAEEAAEVSLDDLPYQLERLTGKIRELRQEKESLHEEFGVLKQQYDEKIAGRAEEAAAAAEEAQGTLSRLAKHVGRYLQLKTAASILQRALERYQEEYQDPVLVRAGEIFAKLTSGAFQGLAVDFDQQGNPVIKGRRGAELVGVEGMSDGTQDQLYLALRLASIEGFLERGAVLPFIGDDLLVNFDDYRTKAALQVLGELAQRTQVILFTHHLSLVQLAEEAVPEKNLAVRFLREERPVRQLTLFA